MTTAGDLETLYTFPGEALTFPAVLAVAADETVVKEIAAGRVAFPE